MPIKKFDPLYDTNYTDDLASYLSTIFPENFPWRKNKYLLRAHREAGRREREAAKRATERFVIRYGKFPKKALSVTTCPFRDCDHNCIDRGTKPLSEIFDLHVQCVHKIKPTKACLDLIESKIREYRSLRFKCYLDPFLYVSLESVTQE